MDYDIDETNVNEKHIDDFSIDYQLPIEKTLLRSSRKKLLLEAFFLCEGAITDRRLYCFASGYVY